jgi:hypothetical protein
MSLTHAVPGRLSLDDQRDSAKLPPVGSPEDICPELVAYWEYRLNGGTAAQTFDEWCQMQQDIDNAYALYNPAAIMTRAMFSPAADPKKIDEIEMCWILHNTPVQPPIETVSDNLQDEIDPSASSSSIPATTCRRRTKHRIEAMYVRFGRQLGILPMGPDFESTLDRAGRRRSFTKDERLLLEQGIIPTVNRRFIKMTRNDRDLLRKAKAKRAIKRIPREDRRYGTAALRGTWILA